MGVAYVAERGTGTQSHTGGGSASFTIAPTVNTVANHFLTLIMSDTVGVVSSITDSKGNPWAIDKAGVDAGTGMTATIASSQNTSALLTTDLITLNFSTNSKKIQWFLEEFSAVATSAAADQSATAASTTATTHDTGTTGVTSQSDEFYVVGLGYPATGIGMAKAAGDSAFTTTTVEQVGAGGLASYKILVATGTQRSQPTSTSTTNSVGVIVTYKGVAATSIFPSQYMRGGGIFQPNNSKTIITDY